jgi:branched-chain amino acid transport system ATP-binding protein
MTPILKIRNTQVWHGKIPAVRNVSVDVQPGTTVTIIGANGAGKSTLLNSIAGLVPSEGEYCCDGRSLAGVNTETRTQWGPCLVLESRELFASMTVRENLQLGGFVRRRDAPRATLNLSRSMLGFCGLRSGATRTRVRCRVENVKCGLSDAP